MKTWANVLLGIWLVLTGLVHLGGVSFSKSGIILAVLGIVTGILFFIANSSEKIGTQIGSMLLGPGWSRAAWYRSFTYTSPGAALFSPSLAWQQALWF
jgi:hypothetical protein